jgi:hypothetical protein
MNRDEGDERDGKSSFQIPNFKSVKREQDFFCVLHSTFYILPKP